jgi:hypothetical protein
VAQSDPVPLTPTNGSTSPFPIDQIPIPMHQNSSSRTNLVNNPGFLSVTRAQKKKKPKKGKKFASTPHLPHPDSYAQQMVNLNLANPGIFQNQQNPKLDRKRAFKGQDLQNYI